MLDKRKKAMEERNYSEQSLLKLKFATAIITVNNKLYSDACDEVVIRKFKELRWLTSTAPKEIRNGGIGS